jgi:hypothetical protein
LKQRQLVSLCLELKIAKLYEMMMRLPHFFRNHI